MYWCETSVKKNDVTDQIKIKDYDCEHTFNIRAGV